MKLSDLNDYGKYIDALAQVDSIGVLWQWFKWIPWPLQLFVVVGTLGLLALLYIFIAGFLSDNHG